MRGQLAVADTISIGIEEEYLLVNPQTRELTKRQVAGFMDKCKALLGPRVMHEMLQSQIEIGTGVCQTIDQARAELIELRCGVASVAEQYDLRIFMPHLLALSSSSPFWEGIDTGLKSMRPTIAGHLPRSGLPESFDNWNDWTDMLDEMTACGMITDPSRIWWDLRPSVRHPTLEIRICDVCTWVEDALCIAALYQSLLTFLCYLRANNQRWRHYRRILILENKWRAQRYGIEAELGDFGKRKAVPLPELIDELVELLRPHAESLGCIKEVEHARVIASRGSSSDQQLGVYKRALANGASDRDAQVAVVDWLIAESVPSKWGRETAPAGSQELEPG